MKNNKGFTLIELLIVVAMIGILLGITIPQFQRYKAGEIYKEYVKSDTSLPFIEWLPTSNFKVGKTGLDMFIRAKQKELDQDFKLKQLVKQNAESRKNRNNEPTSSVSNSREHGKTKERLSWDSQNTAKW